MSVETRLTRLRRAAVAGAALSAIVLGTGVVTAQAEVPDDGLVAEYLFDQDEGAEVPNTAPQSDVGPAAVHNVRDTDWTGTAMTMRGGSKSSSGNWVELPDDLLVGQNSATITAEVQASAAMLDGFHFLWNIGNESSATEYFFATLNCGSSRSPLVGLKSDGIERLVQASSCGLAANQWVNVTAVVDGDDGTASLFLDGERVAHGAMEFTPGDVADQSLNTIGRAPWPDPLFQGAISAFRVYDRALSAEEVAEVADTDGEIHAAELQAQAEAILAGLELADLETSSDVDLPAAGGNVTWESSAPAVVGADGAVNPPLAGESAVRVELTATATVRHISVSQTITVTVLPSSETPEERAKRLAERVIMPPVVESGTALPAAPQGTTVAVASISGAQVEDGAIVADEVVDAELTLRVTDVATEASVERTFAVQVLPNEEATELLAYNRVATSATEANNADVALSMHLALEQEGDWSPLNGNYGIFFPKTSQTPPTSGTSSSIIRSLRDPHLFHLADGDFGVVATRTARNGGSDGTQESSMLLARSSDLLSYEEVGLVDLGVSSGVNDPAVVYDSAAEHYVVTWTSNGGAEMYTTFTDLTDDETRGDVQRGTVAATAGVTQSDVPNYDTGNSLPVTTDIAAALQVRFGRISNTGVRPLEAVSIAQGDELDEAGLPGRAVLDYSDGSTASRAIEWDADSVAAIDTATVGDYEVTGTIKAPEYVTPFADERADPTIFRFDWNGEQKFLMIATEDLNMNPIDPANGPHMPFRMADRVEDLSDAAIRDGRNVEVDLLRAGDTDARGEVMTGCFWAPEIHLIDDTLTIHFMPCYDGSNGRPDMWTGRASIIQLKKDGEGNDLDPTVPENWTKAEQVLQADGSPLNPVQNISLDMTYFEDSGQSYYAWQMLGAVFIATMDPAEPTRLTSEPVRIIAPEYAWDNTIAEGANVHVHDGTVYMIYSGSTVGDTYTTGLITADAGQNADLTDPASWTKLNYPIQKSGIFNGEWQLGTGHGMWSHDEDDNLLYVFHARTDNRGLSGRDMFVRRVHWAADGMPVFDMEAHEEIAPGNETVTVAVTVEPGEVTGLDLSAQVDTRCVVGRVVQAVRVTNGEDVPVEVDISSSYGSRSVTLEPGRTASYAFSTRLAQIPAESVEVAGVASIDGETVSDSVTATHEARAC